VRRRKRAPIVPHLRQLPQPSKALYLQTLDPLDGLVIAHYAAFFSI
jgi:hypothetical protein